jgi:hypothetical protein
MSYIPCDHGILSPNGHVSERSRQAALKRLHAKLFPDGLPEPQAQQPTEAERLTRQIAEFEELAARGMHPRKYHKQAQQLRERLAQLTD